MVPSYGLLQVQEDRIPSFRGVGKNVDSRSDYSGFQDGLVDWLWDLLGIARDCGGIAEGLRTKRIGGSRPPERTKNLAPDARWLYIDLETSFQAAKKHWKTAACGDELRPEQGFYVDRPECPQRQRAPVAARQPTAVALGFGKG